MGEVTFKQRKRAVETLAKYINQQDNKQVASIEVHEDIDRTVDEQRGGR